jgi:DNA-binding CsgD family transcriptional regulator
LDSVMSEHEAGRPAALLERDGELTTLTDALLRARDGRGLVVLVEGVAGLGKTSLLDAACGLAAESGFTCLRARATELERDFAYGCMRQLLEPVVAKAGGSDRERLFDGAASLAAPLFTATAAPQLRPSVDNDFSILHGLYWLLNNVAEAGAVAIAVDDVHWSDAESLRFFNYLAPRLDGLRLAVLATTRSGEDLGPDLARLASGPETTVLRPRPLSTGATLRLSERRLGEPVAPEFAIACRQATGGNPFYLDALLREVSERGVRPDTSGAEVVRGIGPPAVAEAVRLRLSDHAEAAGLVRAIAVLGDGASLEEAARLAELPDAEAAPAADLLAALAILRPGGRLEFVHPIVREAVYAGIGPHERAAAHARAAEVLGASGGSEERIAAQIAEAEPAGDAERVALLRRVAAQALQCGGPAAATAWLRRALAEPPPPEVRPHVLLELGFAELRVAAPEAAEHLAAAIEEIREPELLARSARLLANAYTMAGEAERSVETLEAAIRVVEPSDRELALVLEAELAAHARQAPLEARVAVGRRLERLGALAGATPGERLAAAHIAFERARASESVEEATTLLERGLADIRLPAEQELDVTGTFYLLVVGLTATDALERVDSALTEALGDARCRESIPATAFVLAQRARVALKRGALGRAEVDARTALELLNEYGIRLGSALALAVLVEAAVEGGELDSAASALAESDFGVEIPPGMATNPLLEARALLRLAQGRAREALDDLTEFGRRDERWGGANPLASRWRSRAAFALAALGDDRQARATAEEELERARRWGAASGLGVALRAVGLLEGGAASLERLQEAVATLERSPARLEHARALTDLGAALRRMNRRSDARGRLQQGLELANRCGARALAERARTELLAAGGRSSEPEGTGVQQLTASERRVAELAAEGRSNPEIAQALFVTRKTVETHLGRVYRKLDIAGRGQLAGLLSEHS